MKLCVYCGTFNPIHKAHLGVANFIKTHFYFDKILFIPAYRPPHKKDINNNLSTHRYNMVELAIKDEAKFSISDIEFQHERYSYSVNTMEELYKIYPDIEGKISFVIGTDAFRKIQTWYDTDRLKTLIDFIVFPRENDFNSKDLDNLKDLGYNFTCVDLPFDDVSSTDLREKLKNRQSVENLVPKAVEDYIIENGLYLEDEND